MARVTGRRREWAARKAPDLTPDTQTIFRVAV